MVDTLERRQEKKKLIQNITRSSPFSGIKEYETKLQKAIHDQTLEIPEPIRIGVFVDELRYFCQGDLDNIRAGIYVMPDGQVVKKREPYQDTQESEKVHIEDPPYEEIEERMIRILAAPSTYSTNLSVLWNLEEILTQEGYSLENP